VNSERIMFEELKIEAVEHFFDSSAFLNKLTAGGCPFHI
jgi:hypothetical protein